MLSEKKKEKTIISLKLAFELNLKTIPFIDSDIYNTFDGSSTIFLS